MKKLLTLVFITLLIFACTENKQTKDSLTQITFNPKVILLDTVKGYTINLSTGDSIIPLLNEKGEPLQTGTPFHINSRIFNDSASQKPTISKFNPEVITELTLNNTPIILSEKDSTRVQINKEELKTITIQNTLKNEPSNFQITPIGDTIKTGTTVLIKAESLNINFPQASKILKPRIKDEALKNIIYLGAEEGMTINTIKAIVQDERGVFWFGGSKGLGSYDGDNFIFYTKKEGFPSTGINEIIKDSNGNLWIATKTAGLIKYNGQTFINYTSKNGLYKNNLKDVIEDKQGNIWFCYQRGGGMCQLKGDSLIHYTTNEGLSSDNISTLFESENGNLYIGSIDSGFTVKSNTKFTHYTSKNGLSYNSVNTFFEDNAGNMWIGTNSGGLNKFDGQSFIQYGKNNTLFGSLKRVYSIVQDDNDVLFFGTSRGGIIKYDGQSFYKISKLDGMTGKTAYKLYQGDANNIWIGTVTGINKFSSRSFNHIPHFDGQNSVLSMIEDQHGNIWLGTYGGGLYKYDGKSFSIINRKNSQLNNYIWSLYQDSKGNIWIATSIGISLYDGVKCINYSTEHGLSARPISCITEDSSGNMWFGSSTNGITKFDGERFTQYTSDTGLFNYRINKILASKNGAIWFATIGGGLGKIKGDNCTLYTEKEGLANNKITSLFEDHSSNLWIGYEGAGVSIFDRGKFMNFTSEEGISGNSVYSVLEGLNQDIWLGNDIGLNKVATLSKPNDSIPGFNITSYNNNDGLIGMDFIPNRPIIDINNKVWWSTYKGITTLDLNKYTESKAPPRIHLNRITINQTQIDYRNLDITLQNGVKYDSIQAYENYPLGLTLDYDKNHLIFYFNAIDWHAPHKIKYSYLIKGHNKTWSTPSFESKADYRNLPYGNYTFKLRAIGASNVWTETFEYKFKIHPPWWHTWWARFLYFLIAGLTMFNIVRWRTKKLKKQQLKLEKEVETATFKIRKQKDVIEQAHKETQDSINYAERIQRTFLATKEELDQNLTEYFILFKPKDIVSGDFYWAGQLQNGAFGVLNADSTGHGVPGAIMSILNVSSIEKAVEKGVSNPAEIFNYSRRIIIDRLKKDGSVDGGKDGMDASFIAFNTDKTKMNYVAAQTPIWVIRKGELTIIKSEKMPVGNHLKNDSPFVGGQFPLQKGDQIYTLTDGFQDQFGGPKGKKFMTKNLRELIVSISSLPMTEQRETLENTLKEWKGNLEQIDDICIIGIKV